MYNFSGLSSISAHGSSNDVPNLEYRGQQMLRGFYLVIMSVFVLKFLTRTGFVQIFGITLFYCSTYGRGFASVEGAA